MHSNMATDIRTAATDIPMVEVAAIPMATRTEEEVVVPTATHTAERWTITVTTGIRTQIR